MNRDQQWGPNLEGMALWVSPLGFVPWVLAPDLWLWVEERGSLEAALAVRPAEQLSSSTRFWEAPAAGPLPCPGGSGFGVGLVRE